ncbi:MAG TPA: crosslink repair DNA glycosylase YcaQ family protein [Acidimicrobiales bacterium]|nr:crosslink repair DNA glycosylase YcaQ family protein [Acidimicrobiales bacterium]
MADLLSADEARRAFLRAQGVLGAVDRRTGVEGVLRLLGAVQLDTISVLARSHELVAYARLGAVGRAAVESAYWGAPPRAFEYWAHAASVLPMEDWPWFAARRRRYHDYDWSREVSATALAIVRDRLADGPCTATELGGAKRGGPWWDWSEVKIAVERMLAWGEVVCVERRGWKRVYDLPERVVPAALLDAEPDDHECRVQLVQRAAARLGVATVRDLADYYRLKVVDVQGALPDSGLVPVSVAGWPEAAWADPGALARLGERGRHRTTLLSPFDSLVWDRARTLRVFGFEHKLEAYVPKPLRVHGYFTMPLLAGGRLVGRVDPARSGRTLVARQVSVATGAVDALAVALREAAAWVGCDDVVVERVTPTAVLAPLQAALA